MPGKTNSLFPALAVRSMALGSLDGSTVIVIGVGFPLPWDDVTVHWSPLIVSLNRFTTSALAFSPLCSRETIVHSPWSFSSSLFASGDALAAPFSSATSNHDWRSSYQFSTTPLPGVAPSLRKDQLP